jgi:MerR family transcriptional regulator, redox-sensitive transcriptional activator SoxR
MAAANLSISELAARSGIAPSALRFYEAKGLVHPERTPGNQRRYHRANLRRVAFIKAGATAGIPLTEIARSLRALPTHRAPNARDWERLSRRWRDDLDARIATLEALRDRLTTCIGCGCLSIDKCTLLNPEDEASNDGPGPRYLRQPSPRA